MRNIAAGKINPRSRQPYKVNNNFVDCGCRASSLEKRTCCFYGRHPELRRSKSAAIDLARAEKATEEVRNDWFNLLDDAIRTLYDAVRL
jgi:hypothetical protein